MSYGITTSGFVRKPKDIIRSEKVTLARSKFGIDVDFSPYSFEGQWIDVWGDVPRWLTDADGNRRRGLLLHGGEAWIWEPGNDPLLVWLL
jgi:hypothetical protein